MSHAVERTSPQGEPFKGRCIKCGARDLGLVDVLSACPAAHLMSDEIAILNLMDGERG